MDETSQGPQGVQDQHLPSASSQIMPAARKTQGVTAVERALAILDAFLGEGSRGLADLAKATGLAKPTVLRALVSLERTGYIVHFERQPLSARRQDDAARCRVPC